jgi:Na+-transporting NADH:ubiquinone oxidoreductase subunit C
VAKDTVGGTFTVALVICLVCSVLVSVAAVFLKPAQESNKTLDKKRNILMAAGLLRPDDSPTSARIEELYQNIRPQVVDLSTGQYAQGIDAATYDQRKAAADPQTSVAIPSEKDLAGIKKRARYASVYLVEQKGKIRKVILPIHGKGLWSTLYGFLALDAKDLNTIRGLVYYEHAETPGLGGEVDNPNWKALWDGKLAFDGAGEVRIEVIKGRVDPGRPEAKYQVDGLSGATITSRGVANMLNYWLGQDGFGPFLARLKQQGVG